MVLSTTISTTLSFMRWIIRPSSPTHMMSPTFIHILFITSSILSTIRSMEKVMVITSLSIMRMSTMLPITTLATTAICNTLLKSFIAQLQPSSNQNKRIRSHPVSRCQSRNRSHSKRSRRRMNRRCPTSSGRCCRRLPSFSEMLITATMLHCDLAYANH